MSAASARTCASSIDWITWGMLRRRCDIGGNRSIFRLISAARRLPGRPAVTLGDLQGASMRRAFALAVLLLAACRTATPPLPTEPPPQAPPAAATPGPEPKVALVLGGGAARGFAHIGVIRVLEQERIPVDLVVGTSVGSLIGALYASERNSFELEWAAFQLKQEDLFDFRIVNAVLGMGLARGEQLEAFVRAKVKQERIEELKVPFAAVATDLNWGKRVVLDKGSIAKAVHASSAIPGVFEPVSHDGKLLVDGGVIVAPKVGGVGMLDFSQKKQCMDAGIEAARAAVPRIRAAIEAWKARKAAEGVGRS